MITNRWILTAVCLLSISEIAYGHQVGDSSGFLSGLSHPVLGLDHLLAMLSVGILSAQMGGKAVWSVPLTFVLVMLLGGFLGIAGVELPFVERGIAISVLALGIALALEKKLPVVLAMIFVGIFAIFHGHAHGTEMPSLATPAVYAVGFVLGTAGIHIAGVSVGFIAHRFGPQGIAFLRYSGAGIAGMGLCILLQG